jgi:hypothetical protein
MWKWILLAVCSCLAFANSKPHASGGARPGIRSIPTPAASRPRPVVRGFRGGRGAYLPWSGNTEREIYVESPAAPSSNQPKELVVSPTYEKPKISPKLIEIP